MGAEQQEVSLVKPSSITRSFSITKIFNPQSEQTASSSPVTPIGVTNHDEVINGGPSSAVSSYLSLF